MPRVVVAGGGGGGLTALKAIHELASRIGADDLELVLVDRSPTHIWNAGLPWLATGARRREDLEAPLDYVARRYGARFVNAAVEYVDAPNHELVLSTGERLHYDALILSIGVEPDWSAVPGLEASTPPWTLERALKLREALRRVPSGGRVVTGFIAPPFPCPPAPYETAGQYATLLRSRGIRADVVAVTPEPRPLFKMGPAVSSAMEAALEESGARHVKGKIVEIDASSRTLRLEDGERIKWDVLAVTPPFRPVEAVRRSRGIVDSTGWPEADLGRSFRSRRYDDVFVFGDLLAKSTGLPMAGVIYHYAAEHLASAVLEAVGYPTGGAPLKLIAACSMDFGSTAVVPFCDFNPILRGGKPSCAKIYRGGVARLAKAGFEAYWFSVVAPRPGRR